jgi:hypothetical protein
MLSNRDRAVTGCDNVRFSTPDRTALAGSSNALTENDLITVHWLHRLSVRTMDLWFYGKGLRRRATLSQSIKIPYELVRARAQRSDRSSKRKLFDPIKPECRVSLRYPGRVLCAEAVLG